jgi:hypothetical protein
MPPFWAGNQHLYVLLRTQKLWFFKISVFDRDRGGLLMKEAANVAVCMTGREKKSLTPSSYDEVYI